MPVQTHNLILASASPRRRELLGALLGAENFQVISPDVDESSVPLTPEDPGLLVTKLSAMKAQAIAKNHPGHVVIGADTVVVIDNQILGKPADKQEAFAMLSQLQGRMHQVYSGITVCDDAQTISDYLVTNVWMKKMSEDEIHRYIETGEPMDKAGAYAIQGVGSVIIEKIDGCYFNVVGMSMVLLNRLLSKLGISFL